jgi:hypothetical protein
MARVSYKESNADYVIIKFRCNCGEEITTELIPVKENYDLGKEINNFNKKIVCPKCEEEHTLKFYDDMSSSTCEIPSIANDDNIIYLHEIPYEYAKGYDIALIDYIQEMNKLKALIEQFDKMAIYDKTVLYKMVLTYAIAIMDAFLGSTFRYYVFNYDVFKKKYLSFKSKERKSSSDNILNKLKCQSFQNLEYVVIPYYRETFGIHIPISNAIQKSLRIRNTIIHNSSRETDGYENVVGITMIVQLIKEIRALVTFVNTKVLDAIVEEVMLKR